MKGDGRAHDEGAQEYVTRPSDEMVAKTEQIRIGVHGLDLARQIPRGILECIDQSSVRASCVGRGEG